MLKVIPYSLAAAAGIWVCVPLARFLDLSVIAIISGGIGGFLLAYGIVATRLDNRLSALDKIALSDPRVQQRLTDALATRRSRLVAKRLTLFACAVLSGVALGATKLPVAQDFLVSVVILSMSAAISGTVGALLLFVEGADVDARANEIQRYAERVKVGLAEATKLRGARTLAPVKAAAVVKK